MPSKQKSPGPITSNEPQDLSTAESRTENDAIDLSKDGSPSKLSNLTLSLSGSLVRKLKDKAHSEGISVEDFASELLAEGLVLRAWEIMEKKNAMRGPSSNAPSQNNNNSYRNGKNGYRNNNQNGAKRAPDSMQKNSRQSYKNIMEDNANFLEYVRSQEKRDRY